MADPALGARRAGGGDRARPEAGGSGAFVHRGARAARRSHPARAGGVGPRRTAGRLLAFPGELLAPGAADGPGAVPGARAARAGVAAVPLSRPGPAGRLLAGLLARA